MEARASGLLGLIVETSHAGSATESAIAGVLAGAAGEDGGAGFAAWGVAAPTWAMAQGPSSPKHAAKAKPIPRISTLRRGAASLIFACTPS